MKIKWDTVLVNLRKEPIRRDENNNYLLRDAVADMLLSQDDGDKRASGKEKYDCGKLAERIFEEPESDFSHEDLALAKEHVGRKGMTLYVRQVWDLLESSEEKKEE